MKSVATLKNVAGGCASSLARMEQIVATQNAKIDAFEADKRISREYVAEQVKEARAAVQPELTKEVAAINAAVESVKPDHEFYSSRALMLSRIPFHADPAANATIRLSKATELAAMDPPLLQMTFDNAVADGDLALVWACSMAGRAHNNGKLSDLSEIEIPGQAEALQLIASCDACLAKALLIVGGFSGQSMDPVRKLGLAHRAMPDRATHHNSPGRPVGA